MRVVLKNENFYIYITSFCVNLLFYFIQSVTLSQGEVIRIILLKRIVSMKGNRCLVPENKVDRPLQQLIIKTGKIIDRNSVSLLSQGEFVYSLTVVMIPLVFVLERFYLFFSGTPSSP